MYPCTPNIGGCHDRASKHGKHTIGPRVVGLNNIHSVPQKGVMTLERAYGCKSLEQRLGTPARKGTVVVMSPIRSEQHSKP